jgi:hypothetical protein
LNEKNCFIEETKMHTSIIVPTMYKKNPKLVTQNGEKYYTVVIELYNCYYFILYFFFLVNN